MNNSKILSMALLCTCLLSITNGFAASGPAWAGTGTLRSRTQRQLEVTRQERDEARRIGASLRIETGTALERLNSDQKKLRSAIDGLHAASETCGLGWKQETGQLKRELGATQTRVDAVEEQVKTLQEQQPRAQIFPDQGGYKALDMYTRALEIKQKSTELKKALSGGKWCKSYDDCREDCREGVRCVGKVLSIPLGVLAFTYLDDVRTRILPTVLLTAAGVFAGNEIVAQTYDQRRERLYGDQRHTKKICLHELQCAISNCTQHDSEYLKRLLRYNEEQGDNLYYYCQNLNLLDKACCDMRDWCLDDLTISNLNNDLVNLITNHRREIRELVKYKFPVGDPTREQIMRLRF